MSRVLSLIKQFRAANYQDTSGVIVRDIICKEIESAAILDVKECAFEPVVAANSASANTSNPKLPEYNAVESEFTRWWHKDGLGENSLSYRNLKQFYDIIVRQPRAGV